MRVYELRISPYKLVVFQLVRMHFCRRFAQTAEWPALPSLQIVDSPYHVVYMESEKRLISILRPQRDILCFLCLL